MRNEKIRLALLWAVVYIALAAWVAITLVVFVRPYAN